MQHIRILCVGKFKEKYWEMAEAEYLKRLTPYAKVETLCLPEVRLSNDPKEAEILAGIEKEGESILAKIPPKSHCVALCIKGKSLKSEELAAHMENVTLSGVSDITFVIGGSNGLSAAVEKRADFKLSFSPMTFPHQLARVMLLEQIYRSFQIRSGGKYHK